MNVYIVCHTDWDEHTIEAVFSEKELAIKFMDDSSYIGDLHIEVWQMNDPHEHEILERKINQYG